MEPYIHPTAHISGDVTIGQGSIVFPGARISGKNGPVRIGDNVAVEDNCILSGDNSVNSVKGSCKGLEIGNNVIIGHNAVISSSKIGSNNLIGIKAIIHPACQIGDFCTIAAGAVLENGFSLPSNSVIVGSPAKHFTTSMLSSRNWIQISDKDRLAFSNTIIRYLIGDGEKIISPKAEIHPSAVLVGNVEIGSDSIIKSGVVLRGDFGKISIGNHVTISENSVLHAGDPADFKKNRLSMLDIGNHVKIGRSVVLNGRLVENNTTIEDNAFMLHGARIRSHCTILSETGVMTDMEVPRRHFVSGLPGKIFEKRPLNN